MQLAIGVTAHFAGGRSFASLYIALQGLAVQVVDSDGMDPANLRWGQQALAEQTSGRWGGNAQAVKSIALVHPLIWEQARKATRAWEKLTQKQDHGFPVYKEADGV